MNRLIEVEHTLLTLLSPLNHYRGNRFVGQSRDLVKEKVFKSLKLLCLLPCAGILGLS